jgi:serine/threonine protein kinase
MDLQIPERCEFRPGDIIRGSDNTYRIEKQLGEGTFGIVYKVTDAYGQTRALKLLKLWTVPPEVYKGLRDRFIMEFKTGQIKSDYLAHSFSYGDVKNNPYFVMEFCPNGDLRAYVQKSRHIDFSRVGHDVLCGLRDLHKEGKVHRDLKPENVLMRQNYSAVLTDFGIAGDQNKRMTERGIVGKPKQVFGTYPYMPPEQVNPPRGGKATVLPTTDIFSFGVMMYEMMVGKLPFGELERDEHLPKYLENGKRGNWDRNALQNADPTGQWTRVIERCLVPDYKMRISSAVEVINMLPPSHGYTPGVIPEPEPTPDYLYVRQGILLRVMQGDDYGKVFRLNDFIRQQRHIITIGRLDDDVVNDIEITDKESFVSRCHCTLEMVGYNQWLLLDGQSRMNCNYAMKQVGGCLNCKEYCTPQTKQRNGSKWRYSLNGTYLNSDEVNASNGMIIKPGDIITIGDVKLRVEGY